MEDQAMAVLRGDLLEICIATAFIVLGLASCAIAASRRKSGVRVFLWIGLWSAAYGLMHLLNARAVYAALPRPLQAITPLVVTSIMYLVVVVASLAWLDLVRGALRRFVSVLIVAALLTAVIGIGWFIAFGDNQKFMLVNNLIAAVMLVGLLVVLLNRKLSDAFLVLPHRGFLLVATLLFALEALLANLARPLLGLPFHPVLLDHAGFLVLLIAFGYSGLKMVQANEHRLFEIEAELDVARQIQASILPAGAPEIHGLNICSTYKPMTSVAGDFYEFVPVDGKRAGFLVADVCGHGVPAALIASMLKVAVQSVTEHAEHPGQFLAALNRVLSEPLHGQLVSAAYLWVDMNARTAAYSAAGHPPLIRCNSQIERVESNGLLFGVLKEVQYPETRFPLCPGDRLVLYTDGVTEAENTRGVAFGDGELERILTETRCTEAPKVSKQIVSELQQWQRTAEAQDDVTLILIDVN